MTSRSVRSSEDYASKDHQCLSTQPVILNDVTGSTMFTMMLPVSFTSVMCAQCELALICEKTRGAMVDLPILVFSGQCQLSCGQAVEMLINKHEVESQFQLTHVERTACWKNKDLCECIVN